MSRFVRPSFFFPFFFFSSVFLLGFWLFSGDGGGARRVDDAEFVAAVDGEAASG